MRRVCAAVCLACVVLAGPAFGGVLDDHHRAEDVMYRFERGVARAAEVLAEEKSPVLLAAGTPHRYADKFDLSETMGRAVLGGLRTSFDSLGFGEALSASRWVRLRLVVQKNCTAAGSQRIDADTGTVVSVVGISAVVRDFHTEYLWSVSTRYVLTVWRKEHRNSAAVPEVLFQVKQSSEVRTRSKSSPQAEVGPEESEEVGLAWLARASGGEEGGGGSVFSIDRDAGSCRTPARNEEVEALLRSVSALGGWVRWASRVLPVAPCNAAEGAFVPVLPLLERVGSNATCSSMPAADMAVLLQMQRDALVAGAARCAQKKGWGPLARLSALAAHVAVLREAYVSAVQYVENLMREQLVHALGKEVSPPEFTSFMAGHVRELLQSEYAVRGFSRAVRRTPTASPEGTLSLLRGGALSGSDGGGGGGDTDGRLLVHTLVRDVTEVQARAHFALNAASDAALHGTVHLHSTVEYAFGEGDGSKELLLRAAAREFAGFVLLVGRMGPGGRLVPTCALVVKNKETLDIPLTLQTIPPPAEFRDYIASLSPEQQRFAKGYRKMQLAGTLFAFATVQLRPLMERVLNLPANSLVKEFQLTHKLSQLFMDYDVGSEILAYDPDADGEKDTNSTNWQVGCVKQHVDTVLGFIREEQTLLRNEQHRYQHTAADEDEDELPQRKTNVRSGRSRAARQEVDDDAGAAVQHAMEADGTEIAADAGKAGGQDARNNGDAVASQGRRAAAHDMISSFPELLDAALERHDLERALRPTLIETHSHWQLRTRKSLVAPFHTVRLGTDERQRQTARVMSLLDSLTRGGALPIEHSELHVLVPVTHRFAHSLMDMAVVHNMNPIETVDASVLLVAATLFNATADALVSPQQAHLKLSAKHLFRPARDGPHTSD